MFILQFLKSECKRFSMKHSKAYQMSTCHNISFHRKVRKILSSHLRARFQLKSSYRSNDNDASVYWLLPRVAVILTITLWLRRMMVSIIGNGVDAEAEPGMSQEGRVLINSSSTETRRNKILRVSDLVRGTKQVNAERTESVSLFLIWSVHLLEFSLILRLSPIDPVLLIF